MGLTYDKLIQMDLLKQVEETLDSNTLIKIITLLNEIDGIDSFIKNLPSFPGSTDKIIRGELVSVIGATLSIEGTVFGKDEIEATLVKAEHGAFLQQKEQEAENSRIVYKFIKEYVINNIDNIVYSEQLIKQIHSYFTQNMNYLSNVPGEYRNFSVTFGEPRKDSLCLTKNEIETAMANMVNWLNSPSKSLLGRNVLMRAMMAHYYLTEIHPFADGNGRTARALEALILLANKINYYCFWSLANFWSAHKENYLSHLHNIRVTLNPVDFLIWGLEGYKNEIEKIKEKVLKKVKGLMFLDYVTYLENNKKTQKTKINKRIIHILKLLKRAGKISQKKFFATPEAIAMYEKRNPSTRTRDFQKMTSLELIKISKDGEDIFIEPNYEILDTVIYNI